ncbi:MAG: hypothetical protein ACI8WB_004011 [Phenylobacterium sp.]|jgi:hypothetical protein
MKKQQGGKVVVTLAVTLALFFIIALFLSSKGWGYLGYGGAENEPSTFYSGGAYYIYAGQSVREGSTGGPGHRGGGVRGGK